jgi:nucleoid DNA-binding protein
MNKSSLVQAVAAESGCTKVQAEASISSVLSAIKAGLQSDGVVQLIGFGTFKIVNRKARKGRNPKTGEEIQISASKSVGFKVGKSLKQSL